MAKRPHYVVFTYTTNRGITDEQKFFHRRDAAREMHRRSYDRRDYPGWEMVRQGDRLGQIVRAVWGRGWVIVMFHPGDDGFYRDAHDALTGLQAAMILSMRTVDPEGNGG